MTSWNVRLVVRRQKACPLRMTGGRPELRHPSWTASRRFHRIVRSARPSANCVSSRASGGRAVRRAGLSWTIELMLGLELADETLGLGFNPAGAGSSTTNFLTRLSTVGSSPLARGARANAIERDGHLRLIPAGAGSTRRRGRGPCCRGAHPRWRGEHVLPLASRRARVGSSPLARGARLHRHLLAGQAGLIPAGAGSTAL